MKRFSNNMLIHMTQATWHYAREARPRLLLFYVALICANFFIGIQPYVLSKMITTIEKGGSAALHDAMVWTCIYGSLIICFWIIHGPARVIERRTGFIIFYNFVTSLYRKVTAMPLRWHQDHHSGDTINRINKAGRALFNHAQEQFLIIQMVVRFSFAMGMLGYFSPWVLLIAVCTSLAITTFIWRFDGILVPLINNSNEKEHYLNAALFDYISNIVTVITLRLQGQTREEVARRLEAMRPLQYSEYTINEWKWAFVNIVLIVSQAAIVGAYVGFHLWQGQALVIGAVVAIFQYLLMINQVFFDAAQVYARLMQRHVDVRGVRGLLEDHAKLVQEDDEAVSPAWKKIFIKNLSFTHHEGEDVLHHLRDADITIAPGQKIALVGTSGAGKTTLLTLMRGLYEAQQVQVDIDGKTYNRLAPLSAFTTLVPQDSEIFENTILYNLTLGTDVPEGLVQQALHVTTFDEVADKLPHKLMTDIRERGVNLSGGQKQRLALTRGLIAARDSSLLLLDEPTSSVDLPTEGIIFDRMFTAYADKAIIASIHRLHLLPRFDYIALMQDGQIIEQGNFNDLLAKRGEFHKLWQHHLTQSAKGDDV